MRLRKTREGADVGLLFIGVIVTHLPGSLSECRRRWSTWTSGCWQSSLRWQRWGDRLPGQDVRS